MTRTFMLTLALALAPMALATSTRADDAPAVKLQGTWTTEQEDGSIGSWVFESDQVTVTMPNANYVASFQIDAETKPAQVDFQVKEGSAEWAGKTVLGIVQPKGDDMALAIAAPDADRPKNFEPVADQVYVFTLKRKPSASAPVAQEALKKMQGVWVSRQADGDAIWEFEGDRLRVSGPNRQYKARITVDPLAEPHPTMAIHVEDGPPDAEGRANTAIYRFSGETLILCIDGGAGVTPREFVTETGKSYVFELSKKPVVDPK